MGPRGAEVNDVVIIRGVIGPEFKVKVAGGIINYQQAKEFIEMGANRIGTSKAVEIANESGSEIKAGPINE
jgi:deoxyribose-phosphate aldolase